MVDPAPFVVFEDSFGFNDPGTVFYPEAIRQVAEVLAQLTGEEIRQPRSFDANIELYLDLILGRFRSFHDTHRAALAIHEAYRTAGRQYCVYLRSFSLGGIVLDTGFRDGRLMQTQGWIRKDRNAREVVKASLPADLGCVSFVNTFDLYPSGNERGDAVEYMKRVSIPSLRVLSHNWREVVREVLRGARLIVLNAWGEGEGLDYEVRLIRECGLAPRTIVVGRDLGRRGTGGPDDFAAVLELGDATLRPGGRHARDLGAAIEALATDAFVQANQVEDLTGLRCWVIDRAVGTGTKTLVDERFADLPYDQLIPSRLASNWAILRQCFPDVERRWHRLEECMSAGEPPGVEQLADAMYQALSVFYVAVTLERYREMAIALSIVGRAHRTITHELHVMIACYEHAAECAGWLQDAELAEFFATAVKGLRREMAIKEL